MKNLPKILILVAIIALIFTAGCEIGYQFGFNRGQKKVIDKYQCYTDSMKIEFDRQDSLLNIAQKSIDEVYVIWRIRDDAELFINHSEIK